MLSSAPTPTLSASSRVRADWQHGRGKTAPIASAGPDPVGGTFLSPAAASGAGLAMMLAGLIVVGVGIYVEQTVSGDESQRIWLVASGFGGLTLAVVGGFLYAVSWLGRLVRDSHAVHRQIAETLLVLADVTAQTTAASTDVASVHVTVGEGTVVHRRDCPLIAWRPDLTPADDTREHLSTCRVCKPD